MPREVKVTNVRTNDRMIKLSTGTYSMAVITFEFERSAYYFKAMVLLPTFLILTCISTTFWLDPRVSKLLAVRLVVLLMSAICYQSQMSEYISKIPTLPYSNAVSVWHTIGLILIFGSALELGCALFIIQHFGPKRRVRVAGSNVMRAHRVHSIRSDDASSSDEDIIGDFSMKRLEETEAANEEQDMNGDVDAIRLRAAGSSANQPQPSRPLTRGEKATSVLKTLRRALKKGPRLDMISRILYPVLLTVFSSLYAMVYF